MCVGERRSGSAAHKRSNVGELEDQGEVQECSAEKGTSGSLELGQRRAHKIKIGELDGRGACRGMCGRGAPRTQDRDRGA